MSRAWTGRSGPRVALLCEEHDEARVLRLADGLGSRGWDARVIATAEDAAPARALRRLRPRLVHAQSLALAAEHGRAARRAGARVLVTVAGDGVELGSATGGELAWHAADAVHFGDSASEASSRRRGLPERLPRAVVPPAAEAELFTLTPGRAGGGRTLKLVSVAPLHWSQGLDHAVHAVALATGAGVDVSYTIVGSGELLSALAFARHQLGVAARVRLVEHQHAARELALADAALHPQVVDGMARGLARALAAGLPVVIAHPGELVDESPIPLAGFEVPRRDPRALAERIAELARDPDLRARLGAAARELAVERHRPEFELDGLDAFYRRLLADAAPVAEPLPVLATR